MEYLITVFRSRTQVMKFCDLLTKYRISASIINTPREACLGCGLSVKTDVRDFEYVNQLLKISECPSFAGFFIVQERGHHKTVRPL
jgi:hypothetical protein